MRLHSNSVALMFPSSVVRWDIVPSRAAGSGNGSGDDSRMFMFMISIRNATTADMSGATSLW